MPRYTRYVIAEPGIDRTSNSPTHDLFLYCLLLQSVEGRTNLLLLQSELACLGVALYLICNDSIMDLVDAFPFVLANGFLDSTGAMVYYFQQLRSSSEGRGVGHLWCSDCLPGSF